VSEELQRGAALIERMLGDPDLRRRFREDPAAILRQHGLGELATGLGRGRKALMTLELRESRSSLAGVMVAAAAEGVDFAHLAEHLAPQLGHDAGQVVRELVDHPHHAAAAHHPTTPAAPAKAALDTSVPVPALATPEHAASAAPTATPAQSAPSAAQPAAAAAPVAPAAVPATAAPAVSAPESAQLSVTGATETTHGAAGGGQAADGGTALGGADHHAAHHHPASSSPEQAGLSADVHDSILNYPGDDASSQQLAAWMGAHAERAGLPPELPVMAALTESGLRNVSYGDRDSVGFFQMRLGIWNEGPYSGYPDHPDLQIQWFIDHALAVRAQDPQLAQSPNTWGEWVADVEQPAAQYRYRYQLQLPTAQALVHGTDMTAAATAAAVAPPIPVGTAALRVAMHYVGTPYRWGGSTPATGFDCSGLVQYTYAQEGVQLPRVAAEQFDVGIPIARDHLRPGDAVFFADLGGDIHHVGLYIGDGRFVNAPETGQDVKVASLSDPYYAAQYAGARRYTASALSNPSSYARPLPTIGSGGASAAGS
jgi:cell wall-associated NlpC family hydrolase